MIRDPRIWPIRAWYEGSRRCCNQTWGYGKTVTFWSSSLCKLCLDPWLFFVHWWVVVLLQLLQRPLRWREFYFLLMEKIWQTSWYGTALVTQQVVSRWSYRIQDHQWVWDNWFFISRKQIVQDVSRCIEYCLQRCCFVFPFLSRCSVMCCWTLSLWQELQTAADHLSPQHRQKKPESEIVGKFRVCLWLIGKKQIVDSGSFSFLHAQFVVCSFFLDPCCIII